MNIRETIARWLAPEAFRTIERYHYQLACQSEAYRWLAEFPDVCATIEWLEVSEQNHFRALDEAAFEAVPGRPWIRSIRDFREHLRLLRTPAENDAQSPSEASAGNPTTDEPQSRDHAPGDNAPSKSRVTEAEGERDLLKLADMVWQGLLDADDRNSPPEYPEMVLITRQELGSAMGIASIAVAKGGAA